MCTVVVMVVYRHYDGTLPLLGTGSGEGCGCNMICRDHLWVQKVTVVGNAGSEDGRFPAG